MSLGPYKIFATSDQTGRRGWYYPIYLDEKEAMKADITYKGKGIYSKISFLERKGEFYFPNSYKFLGEQNDPIIYETFTGPGKESKFKRIQTRLSSLVPSQFPDFIQSEYDTFVSFIKAYYQFLEQDSGSQELLSNIRQYNDIDKTTTQLVEKFLNSYAHGYYQSEITDNKFIIKNISQVFESKGTEKAYRILFNILYKETIEFFYPRSVILAPSDAVWSTKTFLRAIKTEDKQDFFIFKDTSVRGLTSNASTVITDVTKFNIGPYEVFEFEIDSKQTVGVFTSERIVGQKAYINESNNLIIANLLVDIQSNIISSVTVHRTERGFKENQLLRVIDLDSRSTRPGGFGAILKVRNVNKFGRIKEIDVLDPGVNYSTNLSLEGEVTIPVDYGTFTIIDNAIEINFQNEHDYIPGDIIDLLHIGKPDSNLLGQYYLAKVNMVPDKYTVRSVFPETRALRQISNALPSLTISN